MNSLAKEKLVFNWSGGKDSSLALYKLLQTKQYDVVCLLTSLSQKHQRVSMHGVRIELMQEQAQRIGIPLNTFEIPEAATMEAYEAVMKNTLTNLTQQGVSVSAFGDIFLEDLRKYREEKLATLNIKAIFPLWKIPTKDLVREFIQLGFKTVVTCVDDRYLDKSFAGRVIDEQFLADLPPNVDPCGENGEFHTFVVDGPIFSSPIPYKIGEVIHRTYNTENSSSQLNNGFWYADILPD